MDKDSGKITCQKPSLTVTKTPDNQSISAGTDAEFTMVVSNGGPGTATNVTLNDPLPAGGDWSISGQPAGNMRWGGRVIDVAYTPGHASHHVSYFDRASGTAFVGDTGGIRVAGPHAFAPTPPPDIDIPMWVASLDRLAAWSPESLFVTHFGQYDDAMAHLARFRDTLQRSAAVARDLLKGGAELDEVTLTARWVAWLRQDVRANGASEAQARAAEAAAPFDQVWQGIARYWRKRVEREGAGALDAPLA